MNYKINPYRFSFDKIEGIAEFVDLDESENTYYCDRFYFTTVK